ncbi:hypothetical protein H6770_04120 [Candidatus Peribacteria bacterium]|nr:hypothetical protein [Candidatus Peribacteria bacterium]
MKNPKTAMKMVTIVSFGLSLLLVGVAHYMTIGDFVMMVSDSLGPLSMLGTIWAYILPGLMIVGGALFVVGMYKHIAAWCSGIALGSIPVGMLLKPVLGNAGLGEVMPFAINAFVWLLVYVFVVKMCCCCGGSCEKK